jgi:hypothetical protein
MPHLDGTCSGNEGDIFYQNEVGDSEFKWMRHFGSAWRRRGCLGVRVTFIDINKVIHMPVVP